MFPDIKYALRSMARSPGVTAVALLTLALGIGANTAVFSVLDAVLLRPLPYRDPARLVSIRAQIPSMNIYGAFVEYNTFGEWWKPQSKAFESLIAFTPASATLSSASEPERILTARVNAGFLAMAGVAPEIGRDFLPAEDRPGAPDVAILSHKLWERRFGADRAAVGRAIVLERKSYTIVGVLPAAFDLFGSDFEAYLPIAASTARAPGMPSVGVFARLRPGASVAAAQAEIDGICTRWKQQYPYPRDWGAAVWRVRDWNVREVRSSVWILAVAVGLVLLIACANVANLLLARAGARQREMAIRGTLGAGTGRIVRQLLTESALLGAVACALGLAAAWAGARALAAASTTWLPYQKDISVDARVLGFTLAAALATVLLFGLAPSLACARSNLVENLKEGGRAGEGLRGARFRNLLVVVEVALALLLAIGATLTARSLVRLQAVNPGFEPEGVLKANLTLPSDTYKDPPQRINFYRSLAEALRTIPGAAGAGVVSSLPFSFSKSGSDIQVEGAPPRRPGEQLIAFIRAADPGYFPAVSARLVRGRLFDARDPAGVPVAIINEAMARRGWGGQDPVGRRFTVGRGGTPLTVCGVIADVRQTSLADDPDMEVYMPYPEMPNPAMSLVVHSSGGQDPRRLLPAVRAALKSLDKDLPLSNVGTLAEDVAHSMRARRFSVALLGGFAAIALLLAAVGIYGVVSYSVARRTHEIGVRMALGAARGRIAASIVGQAASLGLIGVAAGVAGALALTRLLRSMLFGVSATDPLVFAGASLFLLAVAALAGYVPARRAAGVDPSEALREE